MAESKPPPATETLAGDEYVAHGRLAHIYAEALLEVADARGQVDAVGDELAGVVQGVFAADPHIERLFSSRAVQRARKEQLLRETFGDKLIQLMLNFLLVLNRKDRLDLLRPIHRAYRDLLDERGKRVRISVRSAVPLDEAQQNRLRDTLRQALKLEPILQVRVEPELLGGLVVQVGDEVYDSSVRSRIETLRNQLLSRSSHEIQVRRDRLSSPT
jgi:F-type H+-transporting ATPase subunit delta